MIIDVTFPMPATIENWDNPKKWQSKKVEVDDSKVISITPYKWGNKSGARIDFLTESYGSAWHFVENLLSHTDMSLIHK